MDFKYIKIGYCSQEVEVCSPSLEFIEKPARRELLIEKVSYDDYTT